MIVGTMCMPRELNSLLCVWGVGRIQHWTIEMAIPIKEWLQVLDIKHFLRCKNIVLIIIKYFIQTLLQYKV